VVFTGSPADLVGSADTLTARHLREYVGADRVAAASARN
jgi:hypothetical protein